MVRVIIIVLLAVTGIGAIIGGASLIADRSGESLGLSVKILQNSPFVDFFIPGHILFLLLGVGSLVASVIVVLKSKAYPLWTIFFGFTLAIWIAVQILMLQDVHYFHIIFGFVGILSVILGILERNKVFRTRFHNGLSL